MALKASKRYYAWGTVLSLGFFLSMALGPLFAATPSELQDQVSEREASGDLPGARALLEQQPDSPAASAALAQFLDRHNMPGRRDAYLKWASAETDPAQKKLAFRQVLLLDLMAGKEAELGVDLDQYKSNGGSDFTLAAKRAAPSDLYSTITIPGPLSSFARMAALAPDLAPEELLPALARNVVTNGFQAIGNETLEPTEYLRLLTRYVNQARELQTLGGKEQKIVIPTCDSEETGHLLKVLGYRMRGSCGADIVLETVNATRAFLTVDSGFPLVQLEQDLRANRRFELPFGSTPVPVLYNAAYWTAALPHNNKPEFIDAFLSDPALCRLYLGLSRLDRPTADALRKQAPATKLMLHAHVLDFFGGMFQLRNGAAVVPGSPKVWASLVGVSPSNGGAFYEKLITVDDGWLASYYDALSRIEGPTSDYLNSPDRLKRFYEALKGKITTPGPARPVFRSSTELLLLTNSLRIDANGRPHIPGGIEVWRTLFIKHPHGKYDGKLTRSAASWRDEDDVLEALFALSRKSVENEPLVVFLALNDVDHYRAKPLSAQLASRLAFSYRNFGSQYSVFADVPSLSEASISRYLDVSVEAAAMHDTMLKSDQIGIAQSLIGLWQILCRDNAIPVDAQDKAFSKILEPFGKTKTSAEVFDAGRSGLNVLLAAANAPETGKRQDRLIDLLLGSPDANPGKSAPAESFLRIYDAQRLIPADSLFVIADHLGKGDADKKVMSAITSQIARLEETQPLRKSLTSEERSMLALGYWSERHIDQERKVDLESLTKQSERKESRGALTPFLRDSLVGLLYCYYAPPGAQLLLTNPVFVRNHDFIGAQGLPMEWHSTEIAGTGWPSSAGGRLMGSLSSLPYALAEAEQNFLTPTREQALIWGDLVPQIIVDATVIRWKNVSPVQLRWVALQFERGRNMLAAASLDPNLRTAVLTSYARLANPARVERLADYLDSRQLSQAEAEMPPVELYALATDTNLKAMSPDLASLQIDEMAQSHAAAVAPETIARLFGTPKPTLAHSYLPGLIHLRTFPSLMGYSSRILAESWQSDGLYYAALADELGVPATQLDVYVPEWTRSTVENIFATHLEDWPALLRALHQVGDIARRHGTQTAAVTTTSEN